MDFFQLELQIISDDELERHRLEQQENQLRLFDDRRFVYHELDLPRELRHEHRF